MAYMAQYPYNSFYNLKAHKEIEDIEKEIEEEKAKPDRDIHRIHKLRQEQLLAGLFSTDQLGSMYGKYRSPW